MKRQELRRQTVAASKSFGLPQVDEDENGLNNPGTHSVASTARYDEAANKDVDSGKDLPYDQISNSTQKNSVMTLEAQ